MARPKTEINPEPANRLKILLKETNMKQTELSDRIYLSQQTISKIINRHASLTLDNAIRIANLFPDKYSAYWLLGELPIEIRTKNDLRLENIRMIQSQFDKKKSKQLAIKEAIESCGFSVDCESNSVIVKKNSSSDEIILSKSEVVELCNELAAMLEAFAEYHFSKNLKQEYSQEGDIE